jgi:hypothetical protein
MLAAVASQSAASGRRGSAPGPFAGHRAPVRGRVCARVCGIVALLWSSAAAAWLGPPLAAPPDAHLDARPDPAQAPQGPASDPFADPAPRDPDDSEFMPPPHNQLGTWSAGRTRPLTRGFDDDHWVMLSAVPTYAALHVPFIGRGGGPFRGGGIAVELDARLGVRWLFLRAFASHTVHPVFANSSLDNDGKLVDLARGGSLQATNTGASLVYALDLGRFVPRVDVGAGLLFVRSPDAIQAGQWGGVCRDGGVCDLGLACSSDAVCRPSPYPEFHAGVGLDLLLGRRWAVGVAVRYYALLAAIAELPIYLHGSLRLSVRF